MAYKQVALNFMNKAAVEIKQGLGENKTDITVSCDGTWQKRGFSSLNGVVTIISSDTRKCIDYRIKSKVCH